MTALMDRSQAETEAEPPPGRRARFSPWTIVRYIALLAGGVVTILPFVWLVRSALMGNNQIFTAPPEWIPKPFEWSNFSNVFSSVPFGRYFFNSFLIEVFVLIGTLFSCTFAAFSFSRLRWRGRDLVFALLLTGVMLPYAVTLIPTFMAWNKLGAINTFYPLTVPSFFASGAAFNIFLLRQFFLTIPYELDEAAYIDGANPFTVFWRIILPLSKPPLIVVTVFTFLAVWNDYLNPLIYLNDQRKFTVALGLAGFQGQYTAQWGYLMAAATLVVLPIIVLFFLAQRYFVEGVTLTGLKS